MKPFPGPIADWLKTPDGQLVFVDEINHRLLVGDNSGPLREVTSGFRYPRSITVFDSRAYVVDSWNDRVVTFRLPDWKPEFEFGGFFCPSAIAVVHDLLVIADTNNRRLSFHKADGACSFTVGVDGFPKRVSIDEENAIVVHYDNGQTETLHY